MTLLIARLSLLMGGFFRLGTTACLDPSLPLSPLHPNPSQQKYLGR